MRFTLGNRTGWFFRAAAPVLLALAACGGKADAPAAIDGDSDKQIAHLEDQLRAMEGQAAALRRDTTARLDELDQTRRAALDQVVRLRAQKSGTPLPANATATDAKAAKSKGGWFIRSVLILIIIGAIGFIMRLFLGRWGGEDHPAVDAAVGASTEAHYEAVIESAPREEDDTHDEPVIQLRTPPTPPATGTTPPKSSKDDPRDDT